MGFSVRQGERIKGVESGYEEKKKMRDKRKSRRKGQKERAGVLFVVFIALSIILPDHFFKNHTCVKSFKCQLERTLFYSLRGVPGI